MSFRLLTLFKSKQISMELLPNRQLLALGLTISTIGILVSTFQLNNIGKSTPFKLFKIKQERQC